MKIKGAIFDIDGTVLDTMGTWINAGVRYLENLGIEPEEGLGHTLFEMTVSMGAEYLKEHYTLPHSAEEITKIINEDMKQFYITKADFKPGALELLNQFKEKGIPMSVATSTDKECIEPALKRLGIWDYFSPVYCCMDYNTSKNEPFIFYKAMGEMGTSPENTFLFEDGLYSIKTALKEGIITVGIYDEVSLKDQEEMKEVSDIYVTNLTEFDLNQYI